MRLANLLPLLAAVSLAIPTATRAQTAAAENPTSNSSQIMVLPAPGEVTIDGDDQDWDLSAGIWSYNDPTLVQKYSAWTHLMYDAKGVYLLVRYSDLTPMKNATRGENFEQSWRADAFQGRLLFDDKTTEEHQMHLNLFYSSVENAPYMIVHHGGLKSQPPYDQTGPPRPDQLDKYGSNMTAFGGKIAFKPWADGKGYNMEAFWPWSYLRTNAQPLKPGDSFTFGVECMWGSPDGSKLAHRLVDCLRDDKVNRIFFFRARDGWGKAILSPKGHLAISDEQKKLHAERLKLFVNYETVGSIPISYQLPDNRDVTIAIDNSEGRRVRNLFGQFPRPKGPQTDRWDGLDDGGNPVPPGDYHVTIVDHAPVQVKFVNSVYNAATPPWATEDGIKLWGSNHGHPTTAATRGGVITLGFTGTEGAPGLMRITPEGKILWTNTTELLDLALNDQYVFLISREGWTQKTMIRRLNVETGALALFDNPERSSDVILPVPVKEVTDATIAYAYGKIFGYVAGKMVWRVHPETGKIEAEFDAPGLVALENYADQLWALYEDGAVARLDENGQRVKTAFTAAGLQQPRRLAISQDGQKFAITSGATNQVLLFTPKGEPLGAIGHAYESINGQRPAGKFIETDLSRPLGLAFDGTGRLWLAEADGNCRRITCWSPERQLEHQYWGGADYGAMQGFPLVFDSTRFIAHGVEFKLDPHPDVMHRPTAEQPLIFHPELANTRGLVFKYQDHEYAAISQQPKTPGMMLAKRDTQGVFRIVMKVNYPTAGKSPQPGSAWIDKNDNGIVDPGETQEGVKGQSAYWTAGWITPSLDILTADQRIYKLQGLTATGVPLYNFDNPESPAHSLLPSKYQSSAGTSPVVMDAAGNISNGVDFATKDGRVGTYPNPYGRHDAPAARRGLLIAPFRANGVVEGVPGVGSITALGGDRGEWFLMSMDGLYLSSILQDSKADVTLDETFTGQESFGGFLWRDETGRILVQLGGPSYRIMQITGLESTRKNEQTVHITAEQIAEGLKLAQAKLGNAAKEPESLTIARVPRLPSAAIAPETGRSESLIEGAETVRVQEEGDPMRWFRVSLATDGKSLAAMYQVNDANPWENGEGRFTHAFIGGDAVDLKLDLPGRGPVRILAAPVGRQNTVIYWQKQAATPENPTIYSVENNEANAQKFDIVKRLTKAKVSVNKGDRAYTVLITIPLSELGLDPAHLPAEFKGIAGVIYSDPTGTNRATRLYWHDKKTGMVSDVPTESRLDPANWGKITFQK